MQKYTPSQFFNIPGENDWDFLLKSPLTIDLLKANPNKIDYTLFFIDVKEKEIPFHWEYLSGKKLQILTYKKIN